jgi:hypothetical protein
MTVKQEVRELIDELPDDSASLREIRESLRMSKAIDEAKEDFRQGRFYTTEEFEAEMKERWPRISLT